MAKRNPLDVFALNVGRLCNEWQNLETATEVLFACVAKIDDGPTMTMLHVIDMRDLLAAIKLGVVATSTPETEAWTSEVIDAVNYIDNTLRSRRNRYIHDFMWESEAYNGVLRAPREPKVQKPQSRKALSIKREALIESVADLRATVRAVRDTTQWLWQLDGWARHQRRWPDAPLWQPQELRPRHLPQGPTGTPPPDIPFPREL